MESVAIAFQLMALELQTAVEDLNSQGSRLFHASKYSEAKVLSDKGAALQEFCERVNALADEWDLRFSASVTENEDSQEVREATRKILSASKSSKTGLMVRFPDGTIICEDKAADTLVRALEKIGFSKVEALNIPVNKENIVSRSPSMRYNEVKYGGFYIKTHSSTEQKKKNLERISEELDLSLSVSIVA